jgi:dihydropteroate synthase
VRAAALWRLKDNKVLSLDAPMVMGIINCTTDSFFDGGKYLQPDRAVKQGQVLADQGAQILDVGGESSRPGSKPVSLHEELQRVVPVVEGLFSALRQAKQDVVLSVDTSKSGVAAAALQAGADIVNDISGCRFDPGLQDILVQFKPGYVLMHAQGRPETMQHNPVYENVVEEVLRFFEQRMDELISSGLREDSIVLDPGIGFGKHLEDNLQLLRGVERFLALGRPLLIGISNKSLWKDLLGLELDQRGTVSQVATALLTVRGVKVHRVHDVLNTVRTLRVVQALTESGVRA